MRTSTQTAASNGEQKPIGLAADSPNRAPRPYTRRKELLREQADKLAVERDRWAARHPYYYEEEWRYLRFLVPPGKSVLQLGCGNGHLLETLQPSHGVGVDFSAAKIARAHSAHPGLTFVCADVENLPDTPELARTFDVIILPDTIGSLDDCLATLQDLRRFCHADTRLIVSYYTRLWNPLLLLYTNFAASQRFVRRNWLSNQDIANLLQLADFDVIKQEWRMLVPFRLFGLGRLINRFVATLPLIRELCLRNYVVARPRPAAEKAQLSTSVIIPCRNERGNIESAVRRIPRFCDDIEIIFVEGNSSDSTWEEVLRVQRAYPQVNIKTFQQAGKGKGDAVRKGFAEARGDVLMILDADLTMPPEDLPKYYDALATGKGEFINGSRLVYPMQSQAMQFLNHIANHAFARLFSFLLNQRYTDTLCGTKVLRRRDYEEIARNRAYFGEFDPFGDFDLIFGAAKLNLKTAEVPIRYAAREYGEPNISRFSHGWLLLRMVVFAFMKLKAF
ncbi:MAG: glycosyltransferase [Deltaproteobacteria bacterium]|nr:glycosyltransferase [Deltaproteobacteria bacterium]